MYGFICIYLLFNIVFPLPSPSTTYQIKSHSLVAMAAAGGGGGETAMECAKVWWCGGDSA
jgi:hypothetical protein